MAALKQTLRAIEKLESVRAWLEQTGSAGEGESGGNVSSSSSDFRLVDKCDEREPGRALSDCAAGLLADTSLSSAKIEQNVEVPIEEDEHEYDTDGVEDELDEETVSHSFSRYSTE